jgi:hypothetical protein
MIVKSGDPNIKQTAAQGLCSLSNNPEYCKYGRTKDNVVKAIDQALTKNATARFEKHLIEVLTNFLKSAEKRDDIASIASLDAVMAHLKQHLLDYVDYHEQILDILKVFYKVLKIDKNAMRKFFINDDCVINALKEIGGSINIKNRADDYAEEIVVLLDIRDN